LARLTPIRFYGNAAFRFSASALTRVRYAVIILSGASLTSRFLLAAGRRGWPPEQISRLYAEDPSEPVHDVDASGVDAALEGADVSAVDLGAVGQLFLRQAQSLPLFP